MTTVLKARPKGFVNTPAVEEITVRSLRYLKSGFGVHLRGPAGTGKTTLALHLADLLGRPIMLIFGDDQLKSTDLIGSQSGYTRKKVVDNFIHSVVKLEDELRQNWIDSRLTMACREGFTLVYDEFNRSRPEVNNVLLSALEEKLLVLPPGGNRSEYIKVHPQFRAIFTSNSEEYCGVHNTQDALMDRLVTIQMPEPDNLTQQEILIQKIGVNPEEAKRIVHLVKDFCHHTGIEKSSGLRACLMIGKVCQEHNIPVTASSDDFRGVCLDVLLYRSGKPLEKASRILEDVLHKYETPVIKLDTSQRSLKELAKELPKVPEEKVILTVKDDPSSEIADPDEETEILVEEELILPPYEQEVFHYLQNSQGARVSEIESALGINRVQTIDALRSLMKKGILKQRDDRIFVAKTET